MPRRARSPSPLAPATLRWTRSDAMVISGQMLRSRTYRCPPALSSRLMPDEEFDGGGVGNGVVRRDAALVGNVEAGEGVEEEPHGVRRRRPAANIEADAHRRSLTED